MEQRQLDRREFTLQSAMAILSAATITISGCGGDSSPAPSPSPNPNPNPGPTDVTGTVAGNHGHSAVITSAQITAANGMQLSITGVADHPHTVTSECGRGHHDRREAAGLDGLDQRRGALAHGHVQLASPELTVRRPTCSRGSADG